MQWGKREFPIYKVRIEHFVVDSLSAKRRGGAYVPNTHMYYYSCIKILNKVFSETNGRYFFICIF